jgi:hypothetical protein
MPFDSRTLQFDPTQPITDRRASSQANNLDFEHPDNISQDFEGMVDALAEMASRKWGKNKSDGGFTSDAQIAQASSCSLRAALEGFYMKKPRTTHWADGTMITITDKGAHPGDLDIEYATTGTRYASENDGITHDDQSPDTAVDIAEDLTVQKFIKVSHKIEISLKAIQRAAKRGFSEFERKGTALRNQHMFDFNNLVRRGNRKAKVWGICNHPGIRRRTAAFDWGASSPQDIYDEYNACINEMYSSPTEEDVPQYCLMPRRQYNYFATTQFSLATNDKLKQFIETAYADEAIPHKIRPDNGLSKSGPFGGPCALFYTNDAAIARVTAPEYLRLLAPFEENRHVISIEIQTYFAGVQLLDDDTVLVLDGEAADWEAPLEAETFY